MFAYPDGIELVHGLLDQLGIFGEYASLEVANVVAFHADATAWAGHHLDGVKLLLAFAHSLKELAGVRQTVGDADMDWCTIEVNPR